MGGHQWIWVFGDTKLSSTAEVPASAEAPRGLWRAKALTFLFPHATRRGYSACAKRWLLKQAPGLRRLWLITARLRDGRRYSPYVQNLTSSSERPRHLPILTTTGPSPWMLEQGSRRHSACTHSVHPGDHRRNGRTRMGADRQ